MVAFLAVGLFLLLALLASGPLLDGQGERET